MKPGPENLTPKARRTRAALIEAAKTTIGREGAAGVNVMAVCAEAKVGRTSFYNYFEDVDALIATVAIEAAADIKSRFDLLHKNNPRGRARLKHCLGMILSLAESDTETVLLLTSLAQATPEIAKMIETEIMAELSAEPVANAEPYEPLARYLTITTIALARQMGMGVIPADRADKYLVYLMKACE